MRLLRVCTSVFLLMLICDLWLPVSKICLMYEPAFLHHMHMSCSLTNVMGFLTHAHTHIHTRTHKRMCTHPNTHAHTHTHMNTHPNTHMHVRTNACTHTQTHMHARTHTCTHTQTNACTHAHTHVHTPKHTIPLGYIHLPNSIHDNDALCLPESTQALRHCTPSRQGCGWRGGLGRRGHCSGTCCA